MAGSPNYGFRYPVLGDDPNIPEDMKFLAEDVDAKMLTVDATTTSLKSLLTGLSVTSFSATGTLAATVSVATASVVIPSPGFAYLVEVSASYAWGMSASAVSGLIELHINYDSTTYSTNSIAVGRGRAASVTGGGLSQSTVVIPTRRSYGITPFTGSHTLRLHVRNSEPVNNMVITSPSGENSFTVRIVPA